MRVAIDAMILSARDTGVGVWTRGLIRALDQWGGGHEYLVYHGRDAADLPRLRSGRMRYVLLPVRNAVRSLRISYEQFVLPHRLVRDGVDVLHCPAYVQPLRARVPTILTLHDLLALTHPAMCKGLNVLHFRLMLPRSIRAAGLVHCTSRWTLRALSRRFPGPAAAARVITPAADDIFRPAADAAEAERTLARFGLDVPPLLFAGNVEPKKAPTALLEAYAAFRSRSPHAPKLLMVGGEGWGNRSFFAALRRLGLDAEVIRAGYLPRADLPAVYRASRALVFPSIVEGFGLPPLEAMACGTPVICSDAAGLAESTGGAALTVPVGDVAALADAMRRVVESDTLREELRAAGLRRVRRFRWGPRAQEFVRLYRAVAACPRGGRPA